MKLKKFAALALAGVMAVSMLAGCSGKSNNTNPSNPGTDDGETEVVPSSAVVTMFNNGQSVTNKATVKFTDDAKFEANMKKAVETFGQSVDTGEAHTRLIVENYKKITGETFDNTVYWYNGGANWDNGLYKATATPDEVKQDNSKTIMITLAVPASSTIVSSDAAVRNIVSQMNTNVFKNLPATTLDDQKPGEKYVNFTYTGKACVVGATDIADGSPIYYVSCQITQNATVEKAASV